MLANSNLLGRKCITCILPAGGRLVFPGLEKPCPPIAGSNVSPSNGQPNRRLAAEAAHFRPAFQLSSATLPIRGVGESIAQTALFPKLAPQTTTIQA